MNIHQYTLYVIDFEDYGPDEFITIIENHRHLTGAKVFHDCTHEIGEWTDDHPLNQNGTDYEDFFANLADAIPSLAMNGERL